MRVARQHQHTNTRLIRLPAKEGEIGKPVYRFDEMEPNALGTTGAVRHQVVTDFNEVR